MVWIRWLKTISAHLLRLSKRTEILPSTNYEGRLIKSIECMSTDSKNAVIYVRAFAWDCKSAEQERICKAYAKDKRLRVVKVFRDKPSRRWIPSRMSRLKTFAKENMSNIGFVIVYSPISIGKYRFEFFEFLKFFRTLGIKVIFGCHHKSSTSAYEE